MHAFRAFGRSYDLDAVAATVVTGAVGGGLAFWVGMPLPWLSGALIAVAAVSIAGVTFRGARPQFPTDLRLFFIPIVGVAIGGSFTPALLESATRWWPTFLAMLVFIPLAHALSFALYRRLGRIEPVTAYFAAMPGGFVEATVMGEERGAEPALLALLQFSRIIFSILTVPIVFSWIEGAAVGSAAGVQMEGAQYPIGPLDAVILILCAVLGLFGARALRMPAPLITGPLLLSGLAHLTGLTKATPPEWMILVTQVVIGLALGVRFVGFNRALLPRALALAFASVVLLLGVATTLGLIFAPIVGEEVPAIVLAFAPGGLIEMALVAVSLEVSVVYVAAHHVARIVLAVFIAQAAAEAILGPPPRATER